MLNCQKLIDNSVCLKARKKLCDILLAVGYVGGKWCQLMQIIIYLPSSSWIQLLVLVRLPVVTVSNVLY